MFSHTFLDFTNPAVGESGGGLTLPHRGGPIRRGTHPAAGGRAITYPAVGGSGGGWTPPGGDPIRRGIHPAAGGGEYPSGDGGERWWLEPPPPGGDPIPAGASRAAGWVGDG